MTTSFEITFSPISNRNESINYYNENVSRNTWQWSDGKYNKSRIGDYFAFYFHNKELIFHQIIDIKSPEPKHSNWSYNGDQCRNILILSQPLHTIQWTDWLSLNGSQNRMLTYTTKGAIHKLPLVYAQLLEKGTGVAKS